MTDKSGPTNVDFTIVMKPAYIHFECPHCNSEVDIPYKNVAVPEYWGDQWPIVICPECDAELQLDEYDVD